MATTEGFLMPVSMRSISDLVGRIVCVLFHSPAWTSEWVGGEQRYRIRSPRCGRVY
jgi:hypothetical protein